MMGRKRKGGKGPMEGSAEAKRATQVILEVLAGLKGPSEGAETLSVSLPRYYVLETRALEGMVNALEPREKGRGPVSMESRLRALEKERDRLKTELERMRSLVRAAHRTVGLPSKPKDGKGGGKKKGSKKKRRKVNRTRRVLSKLEGEKEGEGKKSTAAAREGAAPLLSEEK